MRVYVGHESVEFLYIFFLFDKEIDKQRVNDQFAVFFLAEIFVAHLRKQLVYVVVNFRISFGSDIKRLRQEELNAGETFQFGN